MKNENELRMLELLNTPDQTNNPKRCLFTSSEFGLPVDDSGIVLSSVFECIVCARLATFYIYTTTL